MVSAVGKPKVGIFSLSSCEGCLVQIVNLEDHLLEIFRRLDIVDCRILGVKKEYDELDVAIVEGAVMSDEEAEELKQIREKSKVLVALGDCACSGGKFIVKDFGVDEISTGLPRKRKVFRADPLDRYVKVDYHLYGCPISKEEFLSLVKDLLLNRTYSPAPYNVCAECILKGNECLLDKGVACLGPIIRGGCGALCPTVGRECIGCRGLSEEPNIESYIEILKDRGLEVPTYLFVLKRRLRGGGHE